MFLKTGEEAKVLVSISTCFSIPALHSPEQVQSPLITAVKKERLAISTIERKMKDEGGWRGRTHLKWTATGDKREEGGCGGGEEGDRMTMSSSFPM